MKWVIKDWANNHPFPNKEFSSFEDGWDFLYQTFQKEINKDEEFLQDYSVEIRG